MSKLSLKKLAITLNGNRIIHDLNLEVNEGEFLVLLGPSGCGKSTLLHAIAGLIEVSHGEVEIAGQDMTEADPSERGIGMVFQSYALYPTMSVEKNMSFGLRIKGLPKAEIKKRIDRVAAILHLEDLLQRKPAALSGGQRQRVAIGRALVREAQVFLFDEPLSNLDAKLRASLRRELKLLHQNLKSTMIYVTHDQVEAMSLATRIVVMRGGEILQIGTPEDVYQRPENSFVAGFLGTPAMNFIAGHLNSEGQFSAEDTDANMLLDLNNYPSRQALNSNCSVLIGIRPEHIRLHPQGALRGILKLVEPMGNHQVLSLQVGAQHLNVTVTEPDACYVELGQRVTFDIDVSKISVFDPQTEQRLS